jgi:TetR/AcrR family transcriptional regulator, cholesterol catabolism regulator
MDESTAGTGVVAPPEALRISPPPKMSSGQAARRQYLLNAALTLIEERDYERISVREIAEFAGVAVATLYHYFPSKEHLFAEALVQWASNMGPNVTRSPLTGTTPDERLEEALIRSAQAFERRPQLARLLMRFETSEEPVTGEAMARLKVTTSHVYLDLLGHLPSDEAIRVVRVLDAVFDSSLRAWSFGRSTAADFQRSLSDAVELVLTRAGTGKDGKPANSR